MELLQSFLFVPADSSEKLANARRLRPDAFIFDLEDSVSAVRKLEARAMIKRELDSTSTFPGKLFVRVNGLGSSLFDDDLRAAVHPGVHGLVLPKCGQSSQLARVHEKMLSLEKQSRIPGGATKLILILETAKGVAYACELARSNSRAIALMFGGEDYCADMGIARTRTGDELTVARSLVALAAKAEGLEAIDGVFTDFKDASGLFEETRRIKQMGFSGKALIHPNQIDVVHSALAPSEEEVSWAEEVVRTFENAGEGVAVVRGKMIDEPVVIQAKRVLQRSVRTRQEKR